MGWFYKGTLCGYWGFVFLRVVKLVITLLIQYRIFEGVLKITCAINNFMSVRDVRTNVKYDDLALIVDTCCINIFITNSTRCSAAVQS